MPKDKKETHQKEVEEDSDQHDSLNDSNLSDHSRVSSDKEEAIANTEWISWGNRIRTMLKEWAPAYRIMILASICMLAFFSRVFSVIRYESIIHEFDPWFNFRATKILVDKGWYDFKYWIDSESWYPLGRYSGHTLFPGLMMTAAG